jgi:hypothetical protein
MIFYLFLLAWFFVTVPRNKKNVHWVEWCFHGGENVDCGLLGVTPHILLCGYQRFKGMCLSGRLVAKVRTQLMSPSTLADGHSTCKPESTFPLSVFILFFLFYFLVSEIWGSHRGEYEDSCFEMSGLCRLHVRNEKCIQYFCWKAYTEETNRKA